MDISRHPGMAIKDYVFSGSQRTFQVTIDEGDPNIDVGFDASVFAHHQCTVGRADVPGQQSIHVELAVKNNFAVWSDRLHLLLRDGSTHGLKPQYKRNLSIKRQCSRFS